MQTYLGFGFIWICMNMIGCESGTDVNGYANVPGFRVYMDLYEYDGMRCQWVCKRTWVSGLHGFA